MKLPAQSALFPAILLPGTHGANRAAAATAPHTIQSGATGAAAWQFNVKLGEGRTTLAVVAHGAGGDSAPARLVTAQKPAPASR